MGILNNTKQQQSHIIDRIDTGMYQIEWHNAMVNICTECIDIYAQIRIEFKGHRTKNGMNLHRRKTNTQRSTA